MVELSGDEKQDIRTWLTQAFVAAAAFDGSEQADNDFYQPLEMFDDFVRTHAFKGGESHLESAVASAAFPEGYPVNMPYNVDEFLDSILPFYQRLVEAKVDLQRMLEEGGADVRESTRNFVNTDEGHMHAATSDKSRSYEVKTQLRLASLIAHLRNDGVMIGGENQPIYMDDLRITFGKVDPDMMREYPYNIVQIPRLNMEIAVCEQASETTFVKRGTVDDVFWDVMSKNDLKARADVWDVPRHNDTQWWNDITRKLSGNAVPSLKKVNVIRWVPSVALDLAKETLLAHYQATGQALSSCAKNGKDEKIGSYILEHGSYADGVLMARGFNERLKRVDTSIAQLNEELANKHEGFDYTNFLNVPLVDLDLAKETLLTHYQATGQALSSCAKNGKGGNYILEHGFYANGVLTSGAFNERLTRVDTSIVQLNEELAQKYDD
ncbi:MAG: hypothetical protein COB14_03125, partial [Alphaproteobacteria bacterium]